MPALLTQLPAPTGVIGLAKSPETTATACERPNDLGTADPIACADGKYVARGHGYGCRQSNCRGTAETTTLQAGEQPKLDPLKESGSGMLREPEKAWMSEIIAKLNEVFGEDTTNDDQLVYVNHVLMGKLMESETLRKQAAHNSKEQFATSPDLRTQVVNAAMDAQDAHMNMSNKLLNSPEVLNGVLDILLNHSKLWEALRGSLQTR
jgi:hypothetical protein